MFERIAVSLLTRFLGNFIAIDPSSLSVALLSGEITLSNILFKPTALDHYDLPYRICYGIIGQLKLKIPWRNLGSEKCLCEISDVVLLGRARRNCLWEEKIEVERFQVVREKQLRAWESVRRAAAAATAAGDGTGQRGAGTASEVEEVAAESVDGSETETGWMEDLQTTILNNIEVHIRNVHVRLEDPTARCVIGVILESIEAITTNEIFEPAFVDADQVRKSERVYKEILLEGFGVYVEVEPKTKLTTTKTEGKLRPVPFYLSDESVLNGEVFSDRDVLKAHLMEFVEDVRKIRSSMEGWGSVFPPLGPHAGAAGDVGAPDPLLSPLSQRRGHGLVDTISSLGLHFVVEPISGKCRAKIQRKNTSPDQLPYDFATPRIQIEVGIRDVCLKFSDAQYPAVMDSVAYLLNYSRFEPFRRWRPVSLPSEDLSWLRGMAKSQFRKPHEDRIVNETASQWWRFLLGSSLSRLSEKRYTFSDLVRRKAAKSRYLELFKMSLGLPWVKAISEDEKVELASFDQSLELRDVIYLRELAHLEMEEEKKRHDYNESNKGFFGWFRSTQMVQLTEDEKKIALQRLRASFMVGDDLATAEDLEDDSTIVLRSGKAVKIPDDFVALSFQFNLSALQLRLLDHSHDDSGSDRVEELLLFRLETVVARWASKQCGEMNLDVSLQDMTATDQVEKSLFHKIIGRRRTRRPPPKIDRLVDSIAGDFYEFEDTTAMSMMEEQDSSLLNADEVESEGEAAEEIESEGEGEEVEMDVGSEEGKMDVESDVEEMNMDVESEEGEMEVDSEGEVEIDSEGEEMEIVYEYVDDSEEEGEGEVVYEYVEEYEEDITDSDSEVDVDSEPEQPTETSKIDESSVFVVISSDDGVDDDDDAFSVPMPLQMEFDSDFSDDDDLLSDAEATETEFFDVPESEPEPSSEPIDAKAAEDRPLISFHFIQNPGSKNFDLSLQASLEQLDIVVDFRLLQRIIGFLSSHSSGLDVSSSIRKNGALLIGRAAGLSLKIALERKKIVLLDVCLSAPRFFLPQDARSEDTGIVVVDLGALEIRSEDDVNQRRSRVEDERWMHEVDDNDFYDKFRIELTDFEVSLSSFSEWQAEMASDSSEIVIIDPKSVLLDRVSLSLWLYALVGAAPSETLPGAKMKGGIHNISLHLSPLKLERTISVVNRLRWLLSDPHGKHSTRRHFGPMLVSAVTSTENSKKEEFVNREYFAELRANATIHFFSDATSDHAVFYIVLLNADVGLEFSAVKITLSASTGKNSVELKCQTDDASGWITSINNVLMHHYGQSSVSSVEGNSDRSVQRQSDSVSNSSLLEIDFLMRRFFVELSDDGDCARSLAHFELNNLQFDLDLKRFDVRINAELKHFALVDLAELGHPRFVCQPSHRKTAIQLDYLRWTDDRSSLRTPRGDSVLNVGFTGFRLLFDQKFFSRLITLVRDCQRTLSGLESFARAISTATVEVLASSSIVEDVSSRPSFILDAKMEDFEIQFVEVDRIISELTMKDFVVTLSTGSSGLKVSAQVRTLLMEDRRNDGKVVLETPADEKEVLVDLHYSLIRGSEGNHLIDLKFGRLEFYYMPEFVFLMYRYFIAGELRDAFAPNAAEESPEILKDSADDGVVGSIDVQSSVALPLQLSAEMSSLALRLVDSGTVFCSLSMEKTSVELVKSRTLLQVTSQIEALEVLDNSQTEHPDVLSTPSGTGLAVLKYSRKYDADLTEPSQRLEVRFGKIALKYLAAFVRRVRFFISSGPFFDVGLVNSGSSPEAGESGSTQDHPLPIVLDVEFASASVECPVSISDTRSAVATVSNLSLKNEFEENLETLTLTVGGIEVFTRTSDSDDLLHLLPETEMRLVFVRGLPGFTGVDSSLVILFERELAIALHHEQFKLLFQILDRNVQDPEGKNSAFVAYRRDFGRQLRPEDESQEQASLSPTPDVAETDVSFTMLLSFRHVSLTLVSDRSELSRTQVTDLRMLYRTVSHGSLLSVYINSLDGSDCRDSADAVFRKYIHPPEQAPLHRSTRQVASSDLLHGVDSDILRESSLLYLEIESKNDLRMIRGFVGRFRLFVLLDLFVATKDFFLDRYDSHQMKMFVPEVDETIPVLLFSDDDDAEEIVVSQSSRLGGDLILNADRRLRFSGARILTLFGDGHAIALDVKSEERAIFLGADVREVRFVNILFRVRGLPDLSHFRCRSFFEFDPSEQKIRTAAIDGCRLVPFDLCLSRLRDSRPAEVKRVFNHLDLRLRDPEIIFPTDLKNVACKQFRLLSRLPAESATTNMLEVLFDGRSKDGKAILSNLVIEAFAEGSPLVEQVLKPTSLEMVIGSSGDDDSAVSEISLTMLSDLEMKLTYRDVKSFVGIYEMIQSTTSPPTPRSERSSDEARSAASDNVELLRRRVGRLEPIQFDLDYELFPEDYGLEQTSSQGSRAESQIPEPALPATAATVDLTKSHYRCSLVAEGREITLRCVNDVTERDMPVARFAIDGMICDAIVDTGEEIAVRAEATLKLAIAFFNVARGGWEPLLDPWRLMCHFGLNKHLLEQDWVANRDYLNALRIPIEDDGVRSRMVVHLADHLEGVPASQNWLNITVTQDMLQSIDALVDLWSEDSLQRDGAVISEAFLPYLVRNHTGCPISFSSEASEEPEFLDVREEKSYASFSPDSDDDSWNSPECSLVFHIPPFRAETVDVHRTNASFLIDHIARLSAWIDVSLVSGRRVITCRSGLVVKNETSESLEIGIVPVQSDPDATGQVTVIGTLRPGEDFGLPLDSQDNLLVLRPYNSFGWSRWEGKGVSPRFSGFIRTRGTKMGSKSAILCSRNLENEDDVVFVVARAMPKSELYGPLDASLPFYRAMNRDFTISLHSPFSIENLLAIPLNVTFYRERKGGTELFSIQLAVGQRESLEIVNPKASLCAEFSLNGMMSSFRSVLGTGAVNTGDPRAILCDPYGRELDLLLDYPDEERGLHVVVYVSHWLCDQSGEGLIAWQMDQRDVFGVRPVAGFGVPSSLASSYGVFASGPPNCGSGFLICPNFSHHEFLKKDGLGVTTASIDPDLEGVSLMGFVWHSQDGFVAATDGMKNWYLGIDHERQVLVVHEQRDLAETWSWVPFRDSDSGCFRSHSQLYIEIIPFSCPGLSRRRSRHCLLKLIHEDVWFHQTNDFTPQATSYEHRHPILFSFSEHSVESRIMVSIGFSGVSDSFPIDQPGHESSLSLISGARRFEIAFYVSLAPGRFGRTKIVTFTPRYWIVNLSRWPLRIRQAGCEFSQTILPKGRLVHHWSEVSGESAIQFSLPDWDQHSWSSPLSLVDLTMDSYYLKLKSSSYDCIVILAATISLSCSTVVVTLEEVTFAPYIIHNKTVGFRIEIHQADCDDDDPEVVLSGERHVFCWDDLEAPKKIDLVISKSTEFGIDPVVLHNVRFDSTRDYSIDFERVPLAVRRIVRGRSKILVVEELSHSYPESPMPSLREEHVMLGPDLLVVLNLDRIGISLVSDQPSEIFFLSTQGVSGQYTSDKKRMTLTLGIQHIQLDDQSREFAVNPVTLSQRTIDKDDSHPFLSLSLVKLAGKNHVEVANLVFDDICIMGSLGFILRVMDVVGFFMKYPVNRASVDDLRSWILWDLPEGHETQKSVWFFDAMTLSEFSLELTWKTGPGDAERLQKLPIGGILASFGLSFLQCTEAPVKFPLFSVTNKCVSLVQLQEQILHHYKSYVLLQWGKILGSLEVIGNPVRMFRDLESGVQDLVDAVRGKTDLIHGVEAASDIMSQMQQDLCARRGASLIARFARSGERTATLLTFDEDLIRKQQASEDAHHPKNVREGFREGFRVLKESLVRGVSGLFTNPFRAAKEEGIGGFFREIHDGMLDASPVALAGVLGATASISEGFAGQEEVLRFFRVRDIRTFRDDGLVIAYSASEALRNASFERMRRMRGKSPEDEYLGRLERPLAGARLSATECVLVTNHSTSRVLILTGEIRWVLNHDDVIAVSTRPQRKQDFVDHVQIRIQTQLQKTTREIELSDFDVAWDFAHVLEAEVEERRRLKDTIVRPCESRNSCEEYMKIKHAREFSHRDYKALCSNPFSCKDYFHGVRRHCRKFTHFCRFGGECSHRLEASCRHNIHRVLDKCPDELSGKPCFDLTPIHRRAFAHSGCPFILLPCSHGKKCRLFVQYLESRVRRQLPGADPEVLLPGMSEAAIDHLKEFSHE